ncbi:MAG: nitrate/nitrite transporter NrtS [Alkalimonas sp.]|nr:nitrate/nitrite transporter NrtS [Alkalimonas sp.]
MKTALYVAIVVSSILNLINQFDALFGEACWRWGMAGLNYLVPYCVASYSGASQRVKQRLSTLKDSET